jgi:pimeloyl-ACP methyl ester carboxylesterase
MQIDTHVLMGVGRSPMRRMRVPVIALAALALTAASAIPATASARSRVTVSKPITFNVQNVNRSKLPCATDGAAYQIKGHLVGPRSALASASKRKRRAKRFSKPSATLYLHGLGFGEWFWNFRGFAGLPPGTSVTPVAIKGYDYADAQAKSGHVSVVIDRLGYDASGHPDGHQTCVGGQADIAHQIVQALRSGSYTVDGGKAARFKRVALGGHSAGGAIAMVEAYSFRDVDALVVMSFSYSNLPRAQIALGPTRDLCQLGGQPAEPGAPSGYAYYGQPTPDDFKAVMLASATPQIADIAATNRNRDPCGDVDSIIPAIIQQRANVPKIKAPVLEICGTKDALYSAVGCSQQQERFTGSRSTKLELVRGAGHGLTVERQAPTFRRKLGRWLSRYGF